MRRLLLSTALALVLFTGPTRAGYHVIGQGLSSCGTWTADRASGQAITWLDDGGWVLGFLSGIGYAEERNGLDPLGG